MLAPATNFEDIEIHRPTPSLRLTVLCPLCKGHGLWNLELNAYGKGRHFQGLCSQCNGWGFVEPGIDETCIHEWKEISRPSTPRSGMHGYECALGCGRKMSVDTSD